MGLKFEKTVPEWLASGVEPPDTLKQRGFMPGYKPPAEYFNWFWFGVSSVLQELQEQLSNAVFGTPTVTAESTDGVTYTATVDGITELTAGLTITIIPNTVSTSISAKLNVNGLGDKYIRQSTTNNSTTGLTPKNANWMAANKPVTIQYDGTQWKTLMSRSNASDMNGILSIANGGTGATSAEDARTNLGIKEHATLDVIPIANGGTEATTAEQARENLGIDEIINNLSVFNAPDYSSGVTLSADTTHTMTSDGFVYIKGERPQGGSASNTIKINDVELDKLQGNDYSTDSLIYPVKKGDTFYFTAGLKTTCKFYKAR